MNEIHRHNNETFHNCMWHYTHWPTGTGLVFIIKVVTTSLRTSIGSNLMVAPLPSSGGLSMENVYSGMTEGSDPIFPPRHLMYFQQQEFPWQGDPFSVDSDMAVIWSKALTGFECITHVLFVVDVLT